MSSGRSLRDLTALTRIFHERFAFKISLQPVIRIRCFSVVACSLLVIATIHAQYIPVSPELGSRLDGKSTFTEIMSVVNQYYDENPNPREQKKWSRWAWYAVRHLDSEGRVDYQPEKYLDIALQREISGTAEQRSSNSGVWSFVGPYDINWTGTNGGSKGLGRVDRLAFHPTNPNIIYAATPAGGLWRTDNAGLNWYSISSSVPNCGISGIVISADDPSGNKIFILTGDSDSGPLGFVSVYGFRRPTIGVLVSTNGGATWNKCGNSGPMLSGLRGYKLLQVRGLPWRMFAATDGGLFYTNDYGNTWSLLDFAGVPIFDLEQHPTDNNILYAAASNTVRKSVNFGADFNIDPTFSPATGAATRTALAVTPSNPNDVYYLKCGAVSRLYKSSTSGDSYTSINSATLITGQFNYNCSLAVSTSTNANIVVGGINIISSSDNGLNFGNITVGLVNGSPPVNYCHPDVHDLGYNPISNLLFAATDGGVYMSSDNGVTWTDRSFGLSCTQYYHMTGFDGTANLLIGGAQDNGTAYTTNGGTMNYSGSGDGFEVSFVAGDNNVFYEIANTFLYRFTRSTNARVILKSHGDTLSFYPNVISHPTNGQTVYEGTANNIWRSDNQGTSWSNIWTQGTSSNGSGHTGGLAVTAAAPNRLYAANATTMWRFENQGGSVFTISGNPGWPASFGVITDIACRSNTADEVWVTMTGNNGLNKVFYSNNAGATWTNFTGSLPDVPVYCIAFDDTGDAYVGTELGVYFMDKFMTDWVPFYNGLPLVPVTDLFINEAFGTIQASTFGRGIWQSDLYSDCGPFLLLSGVSEGQKFYQSGGFIQTIQVLPGSFSNELRLRSPVRILFQDGFRANNNSYVHGVIGNCGQGIFDIQQSPPNDHDADNNDDKLRMKIPLH